MSKMIKIVLILLLILCSIGVAIYFIRNSILEDEYKKRIEEIMADDVEIEKKWLIRKDDIPYDLSKAEKTVIEQTYISFEPEMRVRKLNDGQMYTTAVKTNMTTDGMVRDEEEYVISKEEYDILVQNKQGNTIYKTRYQFLDRGDVIAIDIFSGDLEGLAYMEVEFTSKEEADKYEEPVWAVKDVTDDKNYKNGYLARYGIPESFYTYMGENN